MPVRIFGTIHGAGQFYSNGLERWTIDVKKDEVQGLPYRNGVRTPIVLVVGNDEYRAATRTTARMHVVYISPRLEDRKGRRTNLSTVLSDHHFSKNQAVVLEVQDDRVRLLPRSAQS